MKSRMKMRKAGMMAAKMIQISMGLLTPIGLMNQPRLLGDVGLRLSGTSSFCKHRKEGNVLFNDALNTFYLRLYGIKHIIKDHSDSERERKEGIVLFNDALNTFYLRLYGIKHIIKDHSDSERERKEGIVLFNDTLNTFYLQLYGVKHMVKDHSDSERGNPLPPHRLLFPISSKGSFTCIIPQTG